MVYTMLLWATLFCLFYCCPLLVTCLQSKFIRLEDDTVDKSIYFVNVTSFKHRMQIPNDKQDFYPFFGQWFEEEDVVRVSKDTFESLKSGADLYPMVENATAVCMMQQMRSFCPCSMQNEALSTKNQAQGKKKKKKPRYKKVKAVNYICLLNNEAGSRLYTYLNGSTLSPPHEGLTLSMMPLETLEAFRRKEEEDRLSNVQIVTHYPDTKINVYFRKCSAIVRLLASQEDVVQHQLLHKELCPGSCRPVPEITIPITLLTQLDQLKAQQVVTCAMNVQQLRTRLAEVDQQQRAKGEARNTTSADTLRTVLNLLVALAQRRTEECYEPERWSSPATQMLSPAGTTISGVSRQKVFGLVMWVGSLQKLDLLQRQAAVLTQRPNASPSKNINIVGWSATEEQYGCARKSRCVRTTWDFQYKMYLPRTYMPRNNDGWTCAQRRPLRALSHALLLYDPKFLLMVDDDTFVSNSILFGDAFVQYVKKRLSKENTFVSRLYEADLDITKYGFYWGGAGYLLGKTSLDRLSGYELPGPVAKSGYWTGGVRRTRELSVLFEAMAMSDAYCSATSCLTLPQGAKIGDIGILAQTAIRVVDICKNMMADEDSCYHSDHSLSHCMAHAIYANFTNDVKCSKSDSFWGILPFAMCYSIDKCDPQVHLTCHRHVPDRFNSSQSEKN